MILLPLLLAAPADFGTYRGNPQRTGSDGTPGPASPKVQWVLRSQDHYVAAPVPVGPNLYLAGVGGFNRPVVGLYPLNSNGEPKPVWTRSAPYLRLASVSSPAVSGDLLVFGDGMHQDAGGTLHCLTAAGRPVWQLPLPGDLIHLEGGPTIAGGKVFTGGGAAGVLCVELTTATLDGKKLTVAEIATKQDERWNALQAKFDADKKRDPDFAVPPTEDQLHKPTPAVVWQKGQGRWHVDAPVCVVGDRVLVASGYLDQEKVGERALYCLSAADGAEVWHKPLKLNPWGGAAADGGTVVVAGSSVGYYYAQLRGAKGDLTGFDLTTGAEKWRKELPGGVLGCPTIADGKVVVTATDGKVRAFRLTDGERLWLYDAKSPLFAPPCVSAGVVYVGDLAGVVHAVGLADGSPKWKFDLGTDPAVRSPGMIYGGVTAVGGKLIVATCNLDGPRARQPTCVVCLGP